MTWNPTNANDVELIVSVVSRDDSGTRTGSEGLLNSGRVSVDDFSIETSEDLEPLSGIGNPEALGLSAGDVEHQFSFTIQGEDAEVFKGLTDENGRSNELEIIFRLDDYRDKLTGARTGTRNLSGSSGDPVEYEVGGYATHRDGADN